MARSAASLAMRCVELRWLSPFSQRINIFFGASPTVITFANSCKLRGCEIGWHFRADPSSSAPRPREDHEGLYTAPLKQLAEELKSCYKSCVDITASKSRGAHGR
jgi:hypothetical protein